MSAEVNESGLRSLLERLRTASRTPPQVGLDVGLLAEAADVLEAILEEDPSEAAEGRSKGLTVVHRVPAGGPDGESLRAAPRAVSLIRSVEPVVVYTDGAWRDGSGGWAWWVDEFTFGSGFERFTSDHRMELWAVLEALGAFAPGVELTLVSDSAYVVNCVTERTFEVWRANDWHHQHEPVANRDLWEELLALLAAHLAPVHWVHVPRHGHARGKGASEHREGNARADALAVAALAAARM